MKAIRGKTTLSVPLPNAKVMSSQNTRNNNKDRWGSRDPKLSKSTAQPCTRIPHLRREFYAFCHPKKDWMKTVLAHHIWAWWNSSAQLYQSSVGANRKRNFHTSFQPTESWWVSTQMLKSSPWQTISFLLYAKTLSLKYRRSISSQITYFKKILTQARNNYQKYLD